MGLDTIEQLPGKKDINSQFTPGVNVHKALACLKKIMKDGTYEFGALTVCFYNMSKSEAQTWLEEVKIYPQETRDAIKNCIIKALTNQTDGKDDPIPLTLVWSGGAPGVKCTYNASPPLCTIEISGFPPPMSSALGERKKA
jgi:hypothetical protein